MLTVLYEGSYMFTMPTIDDIFLPCDFVFSTFAGPICILINILPANVPISLTANVQCALPAITIGKANVPVTSMNRNGKGLG